MTKKPRTWNPGRPTIKSLQDELDRAKLNNKALVERLNQYERKTVNLEQQNIELQKQLHWLRQLSQNLSEAVCAHMRNR